jgi:hypothetical protein
VDQDLQDLLALWLGDHDSGEARRHLLLSRLDADPAFRREFIEEIRMLGMLRAVQSSEPRWLRLADELGWSAQQEADADALADRVVEQERKRRRRQRLVFWLPLAAAAAILVAFGLHLANRPESEVPPRVEGVAPWPAEVAVVVQAESVQWLGGPGQTPRVGEVVTTGRLRLRQGRLTMAFFSGAALTVEGPAELEIMTADRVFCYQGRLRARVPQGAEGFTVAAQGYEVVDLGTEFGLNLESGGKARLMVFEGETSVSVFDKDGKSIRGALLESRHAVEVDPSAGGIRDVPAQAEAYVPLGQMVTDLLELDPGYAAEILAAKPWSYWRFESLEGDRVPNEIPGRPALQALGGVELQKSPAGNGWAYFGPGKVAQALLMDADWAPPRAGGYAIEVWVQAELPSPSGVSLTSLVSLIDKDDAHIEKHEAYLELAGRGRRSPHEPCAVRFVDRWPPSTCCGVDVLSRRSLVPSWWHHLLAQRVGDSIELYVDGEQVGSSSSKLNADDNKQSTTACRVLVGRLKQRAQPPCLNEIRAFEGRLAELALYDRPLTLEEIRRHVHLRK